MAGDKKSDKKKKAEEAAKKAQRSQSVIVAAFGEEQKQEFREAFEVLDVDKDGIISRQDLKVTFDALGRDLSEHELDVLMADATGPIDFPMLLTMFYWRLQGTEDDDDTITRCINCYSVGGKIDTAKLREDLVIGVGKFSEEEMDAAFAEVGMDEKGMIDTANFIELLTSTNLD